jgi:hypothetical protein
VIFFLLWPGPPAANELGSPEEVNMTLRFLLTNGIPGGQVRFQPRDAKEPSLTFVKYVIARNDVGMRTTFASGPSNSPEKVSRLREELQQRGIRHTDGSSGADSVTVDFGDDLGLAQLVARIVFERIHNVRIEKDCVAYYKDVAIKNIPRLTGVDDDRNGRV